MKTQAARIAKAVTATAAEPFETLRSQVAKPILEEVGSEFGSFFGAPKGIGRNPSAIAKEDLQRARNEQKLGEMEEKDNQDSQEKAQALYLTIQNEYQSSQTKDSKEQQHLKEEVFELQSEVVKLAKASGIDTKAHLETVPGKIGLLDIKRLTFIVRFLRIKAEESKSAKELVSQRSNAKRTTGMLAWVSGKQMKVHEQGTLHLQG